MKDLATIRPNSLDGIKRLAKQLGKASVIRHSDALDQASRQAGFSNFRHAQAQLSTPNGRSKV